MNKELQDLAFACLPKEVRKEIRLLWELDTMPVHPDYDPDSVAGGAAYVLTEIFGYHNLASDTEPEEILMVERKRVQEAYKHHLKYAKDDDGQWHGGIIFILGEIFGDKCLPDKNASNK